MWHDQFIKITFMRYGHSAVGIVRVTLKSGVLKTWALNHQILCIIESDIRNMEEDTAAYTIQVPHTNGGKDWGWCQGHGRIVVKFDTSLNPKENPTGRNIVNIISGTVAPPPVNVDNAVHIGKGMLEYFKNAWSEGCYDITKKVRNMAERNKSPHFGESEVFYLNAIYPMLRAPLSSDSNINVWDVLSYELAPVPPSMFTNDDMRLCKKRNLLSRDCSWLKFPEDQ